jgi:hypothetical protein
LAKSQDLNKACPYALLRSWDNWQSLNVAGNKIGSYKKISKLFGVCVLLMWVTLDKVTL